MDQIWLAAPSPAMRLWRARDFGWRLNSAALQWAESRGEASDPWPAIAAELRSAQRDAAQSQGRLTCAPLLWHAISLDDGWLVWMTPVASAAAGRSAAWGNAEYQLALVQEFVAIGVFERDMRTFEARWDAQMFRLFGFDPADPVPAFDEVVARVHPDDRERLKSEYARFIREGGRHTLRYRVLRVDGTRRDLESMVEVRHDADGAALLMTGVIVDNTDGAGRLREQEAISEHLARALDLAKISVWRYDLASRRIRFNRVGYELSGLTPHPDGVELEEVRRTAHPEDRQAVIDAAEAAMASNEVVDVEARYRNPSGGYRHVLTRRVAERNERGEAISLLGVSLDLSVQVAERERAQALSQRIELVAEAAELGIWSVDGVTGRVEWNAQMHRIYGMPPGYMPASLADWGDAHVHPDDRGPLCAAREQTIRAGIKAFASEFRIIRPDGTVRWVTSRSRHEEHDGRKVLFGIHLDTTELVTQRERAEEALHDKEAALRASQAKSDFLSRASHELRTPLNAVLGFAQLIEHDGMRASPEVQLERVRHIRSAGEHLLALVDDVLDLAAIEAGSLPIVMEPISIDVVLRDVAQWLGSLAQRAQVTVQVKASGGWVHADSRRLRQIVANLLTNAIKFNQAGGTVWLGARRCAGDRASTWQISVRDDGPGLAPAQQQRLFEAFQRLGAERDRVEGVGLGLLIVQQLAELMDGRVDVTSAPGKGSEFRVSLHSASVAEVLGQVATVPGTLAAPSVMHGAGRLSVLYIEDNPVNVILVEGLIALRAGVELVVAEDGLSGVAAAIADPPDVVLIDMQLPDIDGFEVMRRLRAEPTLEAAVLVALSANSLAEDIDRAMTAGFDAYWTKPIDFKQFLSGLDELVERVGPASPLPAR